MVQFSVLYSIKDGKGKVATTELNLPSTVTLTNWTVFAGQMALLINDIITGAITRIGLVASVTLPVGLRATPGANSDVEEGARFQYKTTNGFFTAMRLPTFDEQFVLPGTATVDIADTDVAAYVTAMTGGIDLTGVGGTGTVAPVDSRNEDIVTLDSAKEQFLSSRGRVS